MRHVRIHRSHSVDSKSGPAYSCRPYFGRGIFAPSRKQVKAHETHVPAQQLKAGTHPRLPRTHGHESRPPGPETAPREGSRPVDALVDATWPVKTTPANNDEPPNKTRYGFSRRVRLPGKAAFSRVFAGARRSRDNWFIVLCRDNGLEQARIGLAIAKKHCRHANDRNRLKRIVRESFRLHQRELGGLDIVVMNRPGAEAAGNRRLFDSLAVHWQRCRRTEHSRQDKS